jgi:hypothetical protein
VSPLYGSNDDLAVRFDLPRLLELGLLQDGEIMCEVEGAHLGARRGVLVVTDLAVHFLSRGTFRPSRNHGVSIGLPEIESTELCDSEPWHRRGSGAFLITRTRRSDEPDLGDAPGEDRPRYAELLEPGEICHVIDEASWLGWRLGTLYVTDRRVAFFMGGVLWPHRCIVSVPFDGYVTPTVFENELGIVLALDHGFDPAEQGTRHEFRVPGRTSAEKLSKAIVEHGRRWRTGGTTGTSLPGPMEPRPATPVRITFDGITGGRERAGEIVQTILRQKEYLEVLGPRSDEVSDAGAPEDEDEGVELRVLGRGVAEWVEAHGGRLFVWGDEFGGFEWMKASIDPPANVEFVEATAVKQFELYLERDLAWNRPIRLERRWFGLRDGIAVDTGLVTG